MRLQEEFVLFAAPDDELAVDEAKDYIRDMKLTREEVKIVRRLDQVLVVTVRPVELIAH